MNKPRFWMCLVDGKESPKMRHKSLKEANQEARRLAALNHGLPVYVLDATHYLMVTLPEPELFTTSNKQINE